jgi:hypothetical protein
MARHADDDPETIRELVEFCDKVAWWLDDCLRIPGTRFRFGLDAVVGVLPLAGDALGFAVSALTLGRAAKAGAPKGLIAKMGRNVAIDFFGSLVPVIGDVFDATFKAHRRNVDLLRAHYAALLPQTAPRRRMPLVARVIVALVIAGIGWAIWHRFGT